MNEQESEEAYLALLAELEFAEDLRREIMLTVGRGKIENTNRNETFVTPFSNRERLLIAIRMLVAAVEPPVQMKYAESSLNETYPDGSQKAEVVFRIDDYRGTNESDLATERDAETFVIPKTEPDSLKSKAESLLKLALELERKSDGNKS